MNAILQLRHRSEANKQTATVSAWAISIVFAGIAVISFAVDQTLTLSPAFGEAGSGAGAVGIEQSITVFSPLRAIDTLIGRAADPSDHAR